MDVNAAYNTISNVLQIQGIPAQMRVEGFSPAGKRIFSFSNNHTTRIVTVPLKGRAPELVLIRGTVNGQIQFKQKVICW